jgi:hypothetical protein
LLNRAIQFVSIRGRLTFVAIVVPIGITVALMMRGATRAMTMSRNQALSKCYFSTIGG